MNRPGHVKPRNVTATDISELEEAKKTLYSFGWATWDGARGDQYLSAVSSSDLSNAHQILGRLVSAARTALKENETPSCNGKKVQIEGRTYTLTEVR